MADDFETYRMGHLVRTAEVWARLLRLGATEETPLDFDFQFEAPSKRAALKLQEALDAYQFEVSSAGVFNRKYLLSSSSGPITWTEEQLLKWVDFLIAVGDSCACTFEGCGASAPRSDV